MLAYTNAAIEKIKKDFSKLSDYFTGAIKGGLVVYFVYALIAGTGLLYVTIPLTAIAAVDLVFYLYTLKKQTQKNVKKTVKNSLGWIRRVIKLLDLAMMIYSIVLTATNVTALSLIFSALVIVFWILDLVFYFISKYIFPWLEYLVVGIQTDLHPIVAVINKFNKKDGQIVLDGTVPSPAKLELDAIVEEKKAEEERIKAEQILSAKQAKKDAKERKKKEKAMKKAAKRSAKRGHTPVVADEIAISEEKQ